MSAFDFLFISIISEVFASSMLKLTNGFKRLLPSVGVVVGYGTAFYFLSLTLQSIAIGTPKTCIKRTFFELQGKVSTIILKMKRIQKTV